MSNHDRKWTTYTKTLYGIPVKAVAYNITDSLDNEFTTIIDCCKHHNMNYINFRSKMRKLLRGKEVPKHFQMTYHGIIFNFERRGVSYAEPK